MGCCSCKSDHVTNLEAPEEELEILKKEKTNGLAFVDAHKTVHEIHFNSDSGLISKTDLDVVSEKLGFVGDTSSSENPFYLLAEKLEVDNGKFDALKLKLLGILLGKGDSYGKSQLLVSVIDEKETGVFTQHQIKHIFNLLMEISVEVIPTPAMNSENAMTGRIAKYLDDLTEFKPQVLDSMARKVTYCKNQVSVENFLDKFKYGEEFSEVLSGVGMRYKLFSHTSKLKDLQSLFKKKHSENEETCIEPNFEDYKEDSQETLEPPKLGFEPKQQVPCKQNLNSKPKSKKLSTAQTGNSTRSTSKDYNEQNSDSSIVIYVNLGPNRREKFQINKEEDPTQQIKEFARKNRMTAKEKNKLVEMVSKIKS